MGYFIAMLVAGYPTGDCLPENFIEHLTPGAPDFAFTLTAVVLAVVFGLLVYKGQNSFALWWTALLQTLWSVPFIFPAYYICKIFPWRSAEHAPSPYQK